MENVKWENIPFGLASLTVFWLKDDKVGIDALRIKEDMFYIYR